MFPSTKMLKNNSGAYTFQTKTVGMQCGYIKYQLVKWLSHKDMQSFAGEFGGQGVHFSAKKKNQMFPHFGTNSLCDVILPYLTMT